MDKAKELSQVRVGFAQFIGRHNEPTTIERITALKPEIDFMARNALVDTAELMRIIRLRIGSEG